MIGLGPPLHDPQRYRYETDLPQVAELSAMRWAVGGHGEAPAGR